MQAPETTFGHRLRQARLLAGFSQSDLEERSGIPKARLSRYENGHVLPSLQTLRRLASSLGVSEATLLGDQRAILERFFEVLIDRGVRISSPEQAGRLANAVAEVALSFAAETPSDDATHQDEADAGGSDTGGEPGPALDG